MPGRIGFEKFEFDPDRPNTPAEIAASLVELLSGFSGRTFPPDSPVINQLQRWLDSFSDGATGFAQLQQVRAALGEQGVLVHWNLYGTPDKLRLYSMEINQLPRLREANGTALCR